MEKVNRNPIKLREKTLADGTKSLYLDIYICGKRSYEYLKLYVLAIGENCSKKEAKEIAAKNAETRKLAEAILARRIFEYNESRSGATPDRSHTSFFAFYDRCWESAEGSINRFYGEARKDLMEYCQNPELRFADADYAFWDGFLKYLKEMKPKCYSKTGVKSSQSRTELVPEDKQRKKIAPNTIKLRFCPIKAVYKEALKMQIVRSNPLYGLKMPEVKDPNKQYLTIDEIKQVMATPYRYTHSDIRRAFLFSCFTGLRYTDVRLLEWRNISVEGGAMILSIDQHKTGKAVSMALSDMAQSFMGERGDDGQRVFPDLNERVSSIHGQLKRWLKDAGIKKDVSFHCARHTHAVTLLTLGSDIYTVSKLLGHSSVKTTEIYAKLVDKKKHEAADRVNDAFK